MSRLLTALQYLVLLVLAVELAFEEAFLVGARPFGQPLPVAALAAVLGNLAVGLAGARVLGRPAGALAPFGLWLVVALALGTGNAVGDRVVPGTWRGVAFLVGGAAAGAAAFALAGARKNGATPGARSRR